MYSTDEQNMTPAVLQCHQTKYRRSTNDELLIITLLIIECRDLRGFILRPLWDEVGGLDMITGVCQKVYRVIQN